MKSPATLWCLPDVCSHILVGPLKRLCDFCRYGAEWADGTRSVPATQINSAAGKDCQRPNGRDESYVQVQKPAWAVLMSSGTAMPVVFGAGGSRLLLGAGAGAGAGPVGPGAAGATLGAAVAPQPLPQLLHCGQTHSTVQPRTQCSFVSGQTISLWIVRTRQRQSQPSSQPLLHGSQALHAAAHPPGHPPPQAPQFSQHSPRSPMRVTPGMQMSLQVQQYL
jgi:hypothetical protein